MASATPLTAIEVRSCGSFWVSCPKPSPSSPSRLSDRHPHVGERQLGGVLRVQAQLVEVAAALEAGHAALEDHQRHAAAPVVRVVAGLDRGDHEIGVDAVGDERLRAVDDVAVAVALGAGAHAGEVGSRAGLGHRDRGDELARDDPRQPALFLLVVAEGQEVRQARVVVQRDAQAGAGDAGVRDLLVQDLVEAEVRHPAAAVLLGHRHAEEAAASGLLEDLARRDARLLPVEVVGDQRLVGEGPERVGEGEMVVVVVLAIHAADSRPSRPRAAGTAVVPGPYADRAG